MTATTTLPPLDTQPPADLQEDHDREDDAVAEREEREELFTEVTSGAVTRLVPFIRPHKTMALAAVGTILAFVAAQLAVPLLIKGAVDSLMNKPGSLGLPLILLAFGAVILINAIANYFSEVTAARLAQRIIFDLRRAMFGHLQRVSQGFMDKSHVGRIMSRLQGDVNALQEFFETSVTAIGDLALLVGIVGVLFALEWRLACLTLLLLPVLIGVR
ncbi:MAG: ABC transporter transmembrane domain-containing protein, partial [Sphingobium sp.]